MRSEELGVEILRERNVRSMNRAAYARSALLDTSNLKQFAAGESILTIAPRAIPKLLTPHS